MCTRLGAIAITLVLTQQAGAAIVTRNAASPVDAAATRATWLADCGVAAPSYLVNFESGFVANQNISGVGGLFPGGLVITDSSSAHNAIIRGASGVGGSSPNGNFAVTQNELPYLDLAWPMPGIDGFGLSDIDHTGTTVRVEFVDGTFTSFTIESTGSGGPTGEFVGVWRNDRPRILRVRMDSSGDGTWGVDDIQWIAACPADLNSDGFVEDSDFIIFVAAYNVLDCADPSMPAGCPSDLNGDGLVDDSDFILFVAAYNELVCP